MTFCLLIIAPVYIVHAQKSGLTIAGGAAIPVGNYTLSNYSPGKGRAKTGFSEEFLYEHRLSQTGFSLMIGVMAKRNMVVPEFAQINYYKAYPSIIAPSYFSTGAVMIGAGYRHGNAKRWFMDEQLLMGVAKLWLSKTSLINVYRIPGPPNIVSAEITTTKGATTDGFAMTFRLGPTYRLNKRFDLFVKAGYWLTLAQLNTTGTFSSGRYTTNPDYMHLSDPSMVTSKDFEAKHQEKNTSTIEVIAGVRLNF